MFPNSEPVKGGRGRYAGGWAHLPAGVPGRGRGARGGPAAGGARGPAAPQPRSPRGGGAGTPGRPPGQNPRRGNGGGGGSAGAAGRGAARGCVRGPDPRGSAPPVPREGLRGFSHRRLPGPRAGSRSATARSPLAARRERGSRALLPASSGDVPFAASWVTGVTQAVSCPSVVHGWAWGAREWPKLCFRG